MNILQFASLQHLGIFTLCPASNMSLSTFLLSILTSFSCVMALSTPTPPPKVPSHVSRLLASFIRERGNITLPSTKLNVPYPSTNGTANDEGDWPPLPISRPLGNDLHLLVTALGARTKPSARPEVTNALDKIVRSIASEGSPIGLINQFIHSSGIVTVEFGDGSHIVLTRDQACKVVRTIRVLMFLYSPREVLRSNIYLGHDPIATFNMTFAKELGG